MGVGRWGKNLLKEFNKQAEIVWCCHNGSADSSKFLAENYPVIKSTTLLEDILDDLSIEAVVVATPTSTHFEIAKRILESNKHLFLEKPGCSNSGELEILCNLAKKGGLVFAVGYEFTHHPALEKINELIKDQDLQFINTEWFKWGTFNDPIHIHLLSHEISIIKKLTKDSIEPVYFKQHKVISCSDIIHAEFAAKKTNISCIINRVSQEKRKTVTVITSNKMFIWSNNELFQIDEQEKILVPVHMSDTSSVNKEVQDFIEAIEKKREPKTNGLFALEVYKIVENLF